MTPTPPDKLDALAVAIARGTGIAEAARQAEIPLRTARRWAAKPKFRLRVDRLRDLATSRAVGILSEGSAVAAAALVKLCLDPDPEIRMRAARGLLADLAAFREATEVGVHGLNCLLWSGGL